MPELNLTTIVTSIIVLLLLALPFVAARLPHSRLPHSRRLVARDTQKAGPGPGFTYALVPPGGHPDEGDGEERGSWQWCLAFIPDETTDGGSEMPPWWAPAPPWNASEEAGPDFTRDADALQAVFDETSAFPAAR
ncbi:MAG: hypothetical protein OXI29_01195 [bacterium]|nr:hypothetical protein [bacterium]MXZ85612.1 hypothetical protein [Acidimicrobiia bacterium]MYB10215.1 hypothetical protein [Acidimicrobiia bacterium]MYG60076.1 hypothetical protein [Acidimicrobiia bacterium]MYG72990.1 hypothetical protein [Acidimicrobiia bacterium]